MRGLWVLTGVLLMPWLVTAQSVDEQIAEAVLPAPESLKAGATIIITGRKRVIAPSTMANIKSWFSSSRRRIKDSIISPFNTATPDSAINPTPAEIDSGMPRNQSASTPPIAPMVTTLLRAFGMRLN